MCLTRLELKVLAEFQVGHVVRPNGACSRKLLKSATQIFCKTKIAKIKSNEFFTFAKLISVRPSIICFNVKLHRLRSHGIR